MADFNNNQKREYDYKPTYTVASFSSYGGNDKYLAIDIWNSSVFFTFGDKTNQDSPIINRISVSADKLDIITNIIGKIVENRISNMISNKPYDFIEPINIEAYTNEANLQNAKVYISIGTISMEGTERVFITGNIDQRSIQVILANKSLSNMTENANFGGKIDVEEASLNRLITILRSIPNQLAHYKRDMSFYRMSNYRKNNSNNGQNTYSRGNTTVPRPSSNVDITISDEEIPF